MRPGTILRRYGTSLHSVDTNFESKALTEIGFRRNHEASIPVEEFEGAYEQVSEHALEATLEGGKVQDEAEQVLLDHLQEQVDELLDGLDAGEVLVVESEQGVDYPKSRHKQRTIVEEGENRLRFDLWVEPPLRVAVYRKTG